jgi:hypothetical protein
MNHYRRFIFWACRRISFTVQKTFLSPSGCTLQSFSGLISFRYASGILKKDFRCHPSRKKG